MKNFDASFNVNNGGENLILFTKLPSGIELALTFTDDNPESEEKVNMKVELHENGQLVQEGGCNTAVLRSSYERLRKSLE